MPITPTGHFMLTSEIKAKVRTDRAVYSRIAEMAESELRGCNDAARRDFLIEKQSEAALALAQADQLEGCLK